MVDVSGIARLQARMKGRLTSPLAKIPLEMPGKTARSSNHGFFGIRVRTPGIAVADINRPGWHPFAL